MKQISPKIIVVAVIVSLFGWYINSQNNCQGAACQTDQASTTTETKPDRFAQIYDVRTAEEFQQEHIEGAFLLPVDQIGSGQLPTVDKNQPIAVYCRSGNRSATAKQLLEAAGFTNVTDLGGISGLKSQGYQTISQ